MVGGGVTTLQGTTFAVEEVKALRAEAGLPGTVALTAVAGVIEKAGDFELALTAMTMVPRPVWVSEALGLHPEREVGA